MTATLNPAWRSYRRWMLLAVGGVGAGVAWAVLMQDAAPSIRWNPGPWLTVPFLAALAAGVVAVLRIWFFRCPNCGHLFHQKWGRLAFDFDFYSSFSKCQHCGLRRWEDPPAREPPDR